MTDSKKLRLFLLLAPLLSGGILVFAFPHWNSNLAVWLWAFPLLAVLWPWRDAEGAGVKTRPFWRGYLAGLAFFLPNLFWVRHSSRVIGGAQDNSWVGLGPELLGFGAVIGLSAYCAVYFGLWAWFTHRHARPSVEKLTKTTWQVSVLHSLNCAFLSSAAWVACEWLRSTTVFTGFGWNGLGVAMHKNLVLIQAADLVGVMGLSFLPMFVACTGWNLLTRLVHAYRGEGTCKTRLDLTLALILLLVTASYGMLKVTETRKDDIPVRTVLIQPNVAQVDAWTGRLAEQIYERLNKFTRMYASAREGVTPADLVIWPESALPVNLRDHFGQLPEGWHTRYFDNLLHSGDFALLTGTELHDPDDQAHVSVVLFRGNADNRQEHHKVHLVPFGEYLPLRDIPPFSFLKGVLPGDFQPGKSTEPLHLMQPDVQIIPLVCFEDTVGRVARRFVREAPQMLVALSNDGWFLQSEETEVHLANAIFRAIELRRPMVRASNTGVTCFIDTHGRETSRLHDPETGSTFLEGVLPGEVKVPRVGVMTIYARFGDWFAVSLLVVCVAVWGMRRFGGLKAVKQSEPQGAS
ncbi:MAG: apolipoprotein N-acyltransferase [Prosthecobacter sp.]